MTAPDLIRTPAPLADSTAWHEYFLANARVQCAIPWDEPYQLSAAEYAAVIPSIQEFQLGESSEGKHLYRAAQRYAAQMNDPVYVQAIAAFIREEQRHAQNLRRFLSTQQAPTLASSWVDRIFRGLRRGTNLDLVLSVLVSAEMLANVYYAALAAATASPVLQVLCAQILHDEAGHVQFHCERLASIRARRLQPLAVVARLRHRMLFFGACLVVWGRHAAVFRRAGLLFATYWRLCQRELRW